MKKKIFLSLVLCFPFYLFCQVGIGTISPSPSSALEIKSSNSGILIPRIELLSITDIVTIPNPETSLLVYNLSSISDITPGFYYWDTNWKKLDNINTFVDPTGGWSLSGNRLSMTNQFLGTTNFFPLNFRINNTGFGAFFPNGGIAIGLNSNANVNSAIAIGTNANSFSAVEAIAIGSFSTASAYQSLALGINSSSRGNETIAIGKNSLASGYRATTLGLSSVSSNNNSLAIGNFASSSGQQATAIGFQAEATQANSIILGNSSNNNNRVGIGTNSPDERLHINGSLKLVDGNQGEGKVLVSDAHGKASWSDIDSAKPYGEIFRNASLPLTTGAINFGTNGHSSNVALSSTYVQVRKTGLYRISYTVSLRKNAGSKITPRFYLGIYSTEIVGTSAYTTLTSGDTQTVSMVKLVTLNAYQSVSVYASMSDSNTTLLSGSNLVVEFIR